MMRATGLSHAEMMAMAWSEIYEWEQAVIALKE